MKCTFEGCENELAAKGLCNSHYSQKKRGRALTPLRFKVLDVIRDETGKVCTLCQEHQPYEEFYKNKMGKDGYMSRCKRCHKEYVDARRKEQLLSALVDSWQA